MTATLSLLLLSLACTGDEPVDSGQTGDTGTAPFALADWVDDAAYEARLQALTDLTLATPTGDRVATTDAEDEARDWAVAELEALGWTIEEHPFQWGIPLRTATNLVAVSPWGDTSHVVMMGGHLDTVRGAPGTNDNGTGVVGVIGIAEALTVAVEEGALDPGLQVRAVLWTWEEAVLLGSQRFVADRSDAQLAAVEGYVNVDMIASPNGIPLVLDPDSVESWVPGGGDLSRDAIRHLEDIGVGWEPWELTGNTDHFWFAARGVPVTGVWAGASDEKTEDEAALYGGTAGEPYDSAYHTPADDMGNVDLELALALTGAAAHAVGEAVAE